MRVAYCFNCGIARLHETDQGGYEYCVRCRRDMFFENLMQINPNMIDMIIERSDKKRYWNRLYYEKSGGI